jgi:hypothetical protein
MNSSKALALAALLLSAAVPANTQVSADDIARAIVIGQSYTSGHVYVGGFVEDAAREWPVRIATIALRTPNTPRVSADFIRALDPNSEEQHYFPQKEDGGSAGPQDLFSTIDSMMVVDANLALYRTTTRISKPLAIVGWNERLPASDISFRDAGQLRPTSEADRAEIAEAKKNIPKDYECTTVPQYLDAAKVMLTGKVANVSFRLSTYQTPGCAGHLAEIYVLDVLEPGRDPRRFQFSHYVGLL